MAGTSFAFEAHDPPTRQARWRDRNAVSERQRQVDAYLARPFVAWDGEGITRADGTHVYVLMAWRSAGGDGDYIVNEAGLSTLDILDFILGVGAANPGAIHIIYGGGYDWNMLLRDMQKEAVARLYKHGAVRWRGYRITWRPGKCFSVARGKARGVTMYDVVSFFQTSFVKACDDYLGAGFTNREMIVSNKALRSSFTLTELPNILRYCEAELENLLSLMVELRARLSKVGLHPKRWDGPGALAATLMAREGVASARATLPPDVARAGRYAYAGGRFELVRFGKVMRKAYQYDLNSAYPAALRYVPDLSSGTWEHVTGDPGPRDFALYRIEYRGRDASLPGALFRREENGAVSYPMAVTSWYWSPEYSAAAEYCRRGYGSMRVLEAWIFRPGSDRKPFAFVEPLYLKRQALKRGKDGAHVGLKLALNSLYGKLAQQVGARFQNGEWKLPPYHQLEWAGYVTSYCRAEMLKAALGNLPAVIAFETDAVFTSNELDVDLGEGLGQFERTEYRNLTYVQSGLYFGALADGTPVSKTRGVDKGTLPREAVEQSMRAYAAEDRKVAAALTRFVGAGLALAQSWDRWRTWERMGKSVRVEPSGKRVHARCGCNGARGLQPGVWHKTVCPFVNDAHGAEFPVTWINPNPAMDELAELREGVTEWDE